MDAFEPRGVDLWCAYLRELSDESLISRYRELLCEEEREQEMRLYFGHDRRRYLLTRALVRTVLSRYAPIRPDEWRFTTNRHGRPEVANENPVARSLSFSITHTNGLVLLGVARGRALGVDAEDVCGREAAVELAEHFFATDEAAAVRAVPTGHQQRRFFELWTLKESYMKARGCGLLLRLDKFSFRFPCEHRVGMMIEPELNDVAERWCFWQFALEARYVIAVCAERPHSGAHPVEFHQAIPLVEDRLVELQPLRASEGSGASGARS